MLTLEDLVEYRQGELIHIEWADIQELERQCEHTRCETALSTSVGWFDEVYYSEKYHIPTLVIVRETRGDEIDRQAFPIGCIIKVERLQPSSAPR